MKNVMSIAPYRVPKKNQKAFFELILEKKAYFLEKGYISQRMAMVLRSRKDPEILLEFFEWLGEPACESAKTDPVVLNYWEKMAGLWEDGGFGLIRIVESMEGVLLFDPLFDVIELD